MRPDSIVVHIYLYLLALYSTKYGILLHEFVGMSNHDHPLFTEPTGLGPRLLQQLHAQFARAVNRHFGESDSMFSVKPPSVVRLLAPSDIVRKCIYVLLNPVRAGLVRYAKDWAGVTSWHMEYGVPITIARPAVFFRRSMPATVQLVIVRPPGLFPGLSDREARAKLRAEALIEQGRTIEERRRNGLSFMGMRRVLRQPRHRVPAQQPHTGGISPQVASTDKDARIAALRQIACFVDEHREARLSFEAGDYGVEWPYGTYQMRVRFNVRVKPPP